MVLRGLLFFRVLGHCVPPSVGRRDLCDLLRARAGLHLPLFCMCHVPCPRALAIISGTGVLLQAEVVMEPCTFFMWSAWGRLCTFSCGASGGSPCAVDQVPSCAFSCGAPGGGYVRFHVWHLGEARVLWIERWDWYAVSWSHVCPAPRHRSSSTYASVRSLQFAQVI